ncbi:MAG: sigma-54 dependent transcriptional regulator [Syntrophobacteraceae bacterium]|nr:sigma-54 dependent transcriptional regulator [Desulfobacteraceae bacterium]
MPEKVLIIDDEKDMLMLLQRILSDKIPHQVITENDPLKVSDLLRKEDFSLIVTDLKMPQLNGIQVLEMAKSRDPDIPVVVMTAYGTIESAIEATRKGVFDYITKPFRKERIVHVVQQALKWRQLRKENTLLREKLEASTGSRLLIGTSKAMQNLQRQIDKVAGTSATVLITGESGTGKELVARAIHQFSRRSDKTFIPVNCSAIPESIIESELFGHMRGAFTGAVKDKKGLVEESNHGTLFLDEIGDLSPSMQVKLLRLLQEGEYKPIGSNAIRKVDIRFLAATNQVLLDRIRRGDFREDLFYRLNVINIHLPPLRDRVDDIPLLAAHFLEKHNALHGKSVKKIEHKAMDYLVVRDWPGNVRELENLIERGVIMSASETLLIEDLTSSDAPDTKCAPCVPSSSDDIFDMPFKEAKDKLLEEFQTEYISRILARHAGNVSQAARESGLKRQYLHRLMRETNLESKTFKKPDQAD